MSAMLASDLNNPEFAGAVNPDMRLACKFYSKPVRQAYASEQEGRPIYSDVDYVQIFVPGDSTTVIDTPVRDDHKRRFPLQWAHYQNRHGTDAREVGTPLDKWPRITPAQAEELRALKFYTVENVANASDANLQRIGMIAGMSPFAFREAAMRFLRVAKDDAAVAQATEAAKAAEERTRALEETIAAQQKALEELQARLESTPPAPRRGRPPKED